METNSLLFLRTVELAALSTFPHLGKKDKNLVDQKAVDVINTILTKNNVKAKIAIGEGELDEAPMLYQGQTFVDNSIIDIDIAVDPVEGTIPASLNVEGSISCIAISKANSMMQIPEMYMEKIFIAKKYQDYINLDDINNTLENFAKVINSPKVIILDKPRHRNIISYMEKLGYQVLKIKEGDVLGAIDVVMNNADLLYGIGGAPEGVLMASLAIATNFKLYCRLVSYDQIWPNEPETQKRVMIESKALKHKNLKLGHWFEDINLIDDSQTMFFAASITGGRFLKPIHIENGEYVINSFIGYNNIYHHIISKYPHQKDLENILSLYS